jgi:hypothetical protein
MRFVPFIIPFVTLIRLLRLGTIYHIVNIMDKEQSAIIEQIAKELYASFKMEYDSYSWRSYQSWDQLCEETQKFWIQQVHIVGVKYERNICPE